VTSALVSVFLLFVRDLFPLSIDFLFSIAILGEFIEDDG
jgi:hypothetical protein